MTVSPADTGRERIAAAIVELVGTIGFDATTVDLIAERAGVTREEFESLYADKTECFFAVYEELRVGYVKMNIEAVADGSDWLDGLRRAAYAAYDWFAEDPARARYVAVEALNAGDRGAVELDQTLELLVELVHMGRFELDDPDSVPRTAAVAAVGSIWSMLANRIRQGSFEDAEQVVPQLMSFAIMPYLGPEAAREELKRPRDQEKES